MLKLGLFLCKFKKLFYLGFLIYEGMMVIPFLFSSFNWIICIYLNYLNLPHSCVESEENCLNGNFHNLWVYDGHIFEHYILHQRQVLSRARSFNLLMPRKNQVKIRLTFDEIVQFWNISDEKINYIFWTQIVKFIYLCAKPRR